MNRRLTPLTYDEHRTFGVRGRDTNFSEPIPLNKVSPDYSRADWWKDDGWSNV